MPVVARRTGFGSPESLRRAFVRHLGVTPGAFRASFLTAGRGHEGSGVPGGAVVEAQPDDDELSAA